jgi:hypothetical protein
MTTLAHSRGPTSDAGDDEKRPSAHCVDNSQSSQGRLRPLVPMIERVQLGERTREDAGATSDCELCPWSVTAPLADRALPLFGFGHERPPAQQLARGLDGGVVGPLATTAQALGRRNGRRSCRSVSPGPPPSLTFRSGAEHAACGAVVGG